MGYDRRKRTYESIAAALAVAADTDYTHRPLRAVVEALGPDTENAAPRQAFAQLLRKVADVVDPARPETWTSEWGE